MKISILPGILVCAASLGLLSGCMQNTDKIPVNIGFRPVIGHDTRAEESVPFPEDRTFRLWARADRSGSLYLDDETISHSGDGWFSSKIWPEDKLTFEACWPTDLPVSYSRSEGLQIKDFDCTGADIDVLMAYAYDDYEIDSRVTLPFEHLLARVDFRMMHSLSGDMSVRLRKIEMKGYAVRGDYNTKNSRAWSVGDNSGSYVIYDAGEGEGLTIVGGEPQYVGDDLFVIPQTSKASLEVTCDVRSGSGEWIPEISTIESLDTFWEPSTYYTYTLNLRMDKLVSTTGISSWNNKD